MRWVYERDRASFNIAGSFKADDVVVDAVVSKLRKKYKTPHPIELLAYIGGRAWGKSMSWKSPLREVLTRNLGPFRRVWVIGWEGVQFVYPAL
jgi:hypothetical protein